MKETLFSSCIFFGLCSCGPRAAIAAGRPRIVVREHATQVIVVLLVLGQPAVDEEDPLLALGHFRVTVYMKALREALQPLADLVQRPRLDDRGSCPLNFARSFEKSASVRTRFSARTQRL